MKLTQILKNIILSPVLIAIAIVAGITGIICEIRYAITDGYNGERMTLVWLVPIEISLSAGLIALAPKILHDIDYNIFYLGAVMFWICFVALYSFIKEGFERSEASKDGDTMWMYFGDVVPLFVISVDIIILLIMGLVS